MAARVSYRDRTLVAEHGESILDCLSRNGIDVPHACKAGVCQSCLMQLTQGDMIADAQKGLKATLCKQNLFLSCQLRPTADIAVDLPSGAGLDYRADVVAKRMLSHDVLQLVIKTEIPFECEPGQYLTLINTDGVARSYSVANNPIEEDCIELHIRLLPEGLMSTFVSTRLAVGDALTVRGPTGDCFYMHGADAGYPIVLAGTGTGLAPLYGIARQALRRGHSGQIRLFHGALSVRDLYLVRELDALAARHVNFQYVPCVLQGDSGSGNIEQAVLESLPAERLKTRLYLCGAPDLVNVLRRKAFLSGLASKHIFADPFLRSQPASKAA